MKFSIRKTSKLHEVINLNSIIFPEDDLNVNAKTVGWLVVCDNRKSIGFCTCTDIGYKILFLSRAGLLSEYCGHGLHKRLIRVRIRYARRMNFKTIITYVHKENTKSFVNLIKEGFELYIPEYDYAGKDFFYFKLEL